LSQSLLKLKPLDQIALAEAGIERLSEEFFAELERTLV
jgi:hypothetical protein